MLNNPLKYQVARISSNKPLWHWAMLFDDIIPGYPRGSDIDCCIPYRGHHLFIEAKPLGASITRAQGKVLETIAQKRKNHVLLVGLRNSCDDAFNPMWSLACWTWINHYKWRDPAYAVIGGDAEFKEVMLAWKERIDRREDLLRRKYQLPERLERIQDEILSVS